MKKIIRRVISMALVFAIGFPVVSQSQQVEAARSYPYVLTVGNYQYEVEDSQNAALIAYNGEEEEITIPASVKGIPVTSVVSFGYKLNETTMKITLSEGIKSIDAAAAKYFAVLSFVTVPSTVNYIGVCGLGYATQKSEYLSNWTTSRLNNFKMEVSSEAALEYAKAYSVNYVVKEGITIDSTVVPTIGLDTPQEISAGNSNLAYYSFTPVESGTYCISNTYTPDKTKPYSSPRLTIHETVSGSCISGEPMNNNDYNDSDYEYGKQILYDYCYLQAGKTYTIHKSNWNNGYDTAYASKEDGEAIGCQVQISKTLANEGVNGFIFRKYNDYLDDDDDGYSATDVYELVRYIGDDSTVTIPSTYRGKPVTRIAENAFTGDYQIDKLVIPKSIMSIDEHAFNHCQGIAKIRVENTTSSYGVVSFPLDSYMGNDSTFNTNTIINCQKLSMLYLTTKLFTSCTVSTEGFDDMEMDTYPIKENQNVFKELSDDDYYQTMVYSFTPMTTKGYQLAALYDDYDVDGSIFVFSEDMNVLAVSDYDKDEDSILNIHLTAGKTYYIMVESASSYDFFIEEMAGDWGYIEQKDRVCIDAYLGTDEEVTLPTTMTIDGKEMDVYMSSTLSFRNTSVKKVNIPKSASYVNYLNFGTFDSVQEIVYEEGTKAVYAPTFSSLPSSAKVYIPNSVTYVQDFLSETKTKATIYCGENSETYFYCRSNHYKVSTEGMTKVDDERAMTLGEEYTIEAPSGYDGYCTFTPAISGSYLISTTLKNQDAYGSCVRVCDSEFNRLPVAESCTKTNDTCYVNLEAGKKYIFWYRHGYEFKSTVTTTQEQGLHYTLSGDSYIVDGYTGNETDIVIPDTYNEKPVTGIGYEAFAYHTELDSITVPNSVTSINSYFMLGCDGILIKCGKYSYAYRRFLDSDVSIDTEGMEEMDPFIYIENRNGELILSQYLGDAADVVIPSEVDGKKVISIGLFAFYKNPHVKSIVIPNTVKAMGTAAIYCCVNLTSLTIPNSLREGLDFSCIVYTNPGLVIHCGKYSCASRLAKINEITVDTTNMPQEADPFIYSENLNGTLTLEQYCGDDTDIYVPGTVSGKAVTAISDYSFFKNTNVETVILGKNIQRFSCYSFYGATNLKSVILPYSINYMGSYYGLPKGVVVSGKIDSTYMNKLIERGYSCFDYHQELTDAITTSNNLVSTDYTAASFATLKQAVASGAAISTSDKSSIAQLTSAKNLIDQAQAKLVVNTSSTARGQAKQSVAAVDALTESDYTSGSFSKVTQAKKALEALITGNQTLTSELVTAKTTLDTAIKNLVKQDSEDAVYELEQVIFSLKMLNLSKTAYTSASYQTYAAAMAKAEAIRKEASPLISNVKVATNTLRRSYLNLVTATATVTPTTIKLKLNSLSSLTVKRTSKKKKLTLTWKAVSGASSYKVEIATNKNFTKAKKYTTKKLTLTKTVKKSVKRYYVRVRACGTNEKSATIYSSWINKSVK